MDTIIKILKSSVIGCNSILKDHVDSMSLITLLRNAHPLYRPNFAKQLCEENLLPKDKLTEFANKD